MADETLKEQLSRKTLLEVETLIMNIKHKISNEKDLKLLSRLNSELKTMQEVRDQKQKESGRPLQRSSKSQTKLPLKSYEDFVKSKK